MSLKWEEVKSEMMAKGIFAPAVPYIARTKVPGGWFVKAGVGNDASAFFYPDPEHLWDGSSLP